MARNLEGINNPVNNVSYKHPLCRLTYTKVLVVRWSVCIPPPKNEIWTYLYSLNKWLSKTSINFSKYLVASVTNCTNKTPQSLMQQADPQGSSQWLRISEKRLAKFWIIPAFYPVSLEGDALMHSFWKGIEIKSWFCRTYGKLWILKK